MSRILLIAAVAVAAAIALPSIAQAATIQQDGRGPHRIFVQDTIGESNLLTVEGKQSVVFHDTNVPLDIGRAPTCMPLDPYTVSCSAVRAIELDLGVGFDFTAVDTPYPVEIDGGPGNDRYNSAATKWPSRVNFAGGLGVDTASYGLATAGVNVAVDLEGGDGRPGDDDQIRRDVETILGSNFDDVISGSHRTLQLNGLDGNDAITGGSGAETILGSDGSDRIDARDGAADTIDCGVGLDSALVDTGAEASITRCETVTG